MNNLSIFGIACALAMDAFAVSIATGVSLQTVSLRQTFRLSWHFGLFQAVMPVIGWFAGLTFRHTIEQYDHWVAFSLLLLVALNLIREGCSSHENNQKIDPTRGFTLVILSVATSIDALAMGLSFSVLKLQIWIPAAIIGLVAMIFTIIGLHIGKKVGSAPGLKSAAEISGGIVLVGIGLNILHQHGVL